MNMQGVFRQGYQVVMSSVVSRRLEKDGKILIEFEHDDEGEYTWEYCMLRELDYHIRSITEDNEDYFSGSTEEEIKHMKGDYLKELTLVADILR